MRHKCVIIMMASWILGACVHNNSIKENQTFNLETAIKTEKQNVLSDLSDSLECVALETNDSSLLADRAYILYADEQSIFIRSDAFLYHFKSDGSFLNRIGRKGNAPGEYSILYSVSVDKKNRRLLFYVGQKKIQFWGYNGAFQKEILLDADGEITKIGLLNENRIVAENRNYTDDGLETSTHVFTVDGQLLNKNSMNKDERKVNISMHTSPLIYTRGDAVKYKDINNNILYSFTENSFNQEWIFDLGCYTPSRDVLEDMDKKETLLRDYAQLVDVQESDSRFYLLIVQDNSLRGLILNKTSGVLEYSQTIVVPQKGGGLENDYIDGCSFWPTFISNSNALYSLLPVEKISSSGEENLKQYLPKNIQFIDEMNPIVLKVYEK